jgi:lipoprotein-anchoring transpeptidase ErfK/SrfK
MFRPVPGFLVLLCFAGSVSAAVQIENPNRVVISVRDQKLMLLQNGAKVAVYPVSTSKYGLGDFWGRMTTPLGYMQVAQKIGDHAPVGAVFHNRRFTGEVLRPNAPGRDPVITRIIWLRGLEPQNAHAFRRCIYIHGTPEERTIGHPASYGCIRMKSNDVAALYNQLPIGSLVQVVVDRLPVMPKASKAQLRENAAFINAAGKAENDWMNSARSSAKPSAVRKKSAVVAQNIPQA